MAPHPWTRALVSRPGDKERIYRIIDALTAAIEADDVARPGRALWGPLGPRAREALAAALTEAPARLSTRFRKAAEARWVAGRVRRLRADLALCWNGARGGNRTLMAVAEDAGIGRVFLEFGPLPGRLSVDLRGINHGNSLPRRVDFYRRWAAAHPAAPDWRRLRAELEARRSTRGHVLQEPADLASDGPFVFFPLQVPWDTQIRIYGGRHLSMEAWIREVTAAARALPEGWHLRVKEHPSARESLAHLVAEGDGRVRLDNRTDTFAQVAQSRAVVTVNSSVGLQAFYFDKPVLALGQAFWCFDGLATIAGGPGALHGAFAGAAGLTFDASARDAFMTYLTERFFPREADILSGAWGLGDLVEREREMRSLLAEIEAA